MNDRKRSSLGLEIHVKSSPKVQQSARDATFADTKIAVADIEQDADIEQNADIEQDAADVRSSSPPRAKAAEFIESCVRDSPKDRLRNRSPRSPSNGGFVESLPQRVPPQAAAPGEAGLRTFVRDAVDSHYVDDTMDMLAREHVGSVASLLSNLTLLERALPIATYAALYRAASAAPGLGTSLAPATSEREGNAAVQPRPPVVAGPGSAASAALARARGQHKQQGPPGPREYTGVAALCEDAYPPNEINDGYGAGCGPDPRNRKHSREHQMQWRVGMLTKEMGVAKPVALATYASATPSTPDAMRQGKGDLEAAPPAPIFHEAEQLSAVSPWRLRAAQLASAAVTVVKPTSFTSGVKVGGPDPRLVEALRDAMATADLPTLKASIAAHGATIDAAGGSAVLQRAREMRDLMMQEDESDKDSRISNPSGGGAMNPGRRGSFGRGHEALKAKIAAMQHRAQEESSVVSEPLEHGLVWATQLGFTASTIVLAIFWITSEESEKSAFVTTLLTCAIAAGAYYAKATGYGDYRMPAGNVLPVARYVDWILTTPLMLYELCRLGGADGSTTLMILGCDLITLSFGLISALLDRKGSSRRMLTWFVSAGFFYVLMMMALHGQVANGSALQQPQYVQDLFQQLQILTSITWSCYPLIVFIGRAECQLITKEAEDTILVLLDILSKMGMEALILYSHIDGHAKAHADSSGSSSELSDSLALSGH